LSGRLIPFWVLARGPRGFAGDYGAAWAEVGVLPVRTATTSWRRLTLILPNMVLRWSRTVCAEMDSAVAMSSVECPSITGR